MSEKNAHRFFFHLALIVALMTGAVSPACKFVRGEVSLIEICTAFGLKTVELPSSQQKLPLHKIAKDCLFCLAHHNIKSIKADAQEVKFSAVWFVSNPPQNTRSAAPRLYRAQDYTPRGPPSFS